MFVLRQLVVLCLVPFRLAPAAFYRTLINEPVQPFSYAVRPEPPQLLKSARFVTMEAEFRRRNALE